MNSAIRLFAAAVDFYKSPNLATGISLAEAVFDEVVPFLPHEQLRAMLDDAARRRADAAGDAAMAAKFGA